MPIFQIPRLGCRQSRVGLDTFVWSGGQAMNLHFRPQGPASYLDDRRSKQHRQLGLGGLGVPLRRLPAEGNRFGALVAKLGHHDCERLFQPLGHQAPMAPHVERLPAKQNGVGAKFLSNPFRVERLKLRLTKNSLKPSSR